MKSPLSDNLLKLSRDRVVSRIRGADHIRLAARLGRSIWPSWIAGDLTREAKIVPYYFRNIFSKNTDNAAANDSSSVELGRGKLFNRVAQLRELSLPIYITSSRSANEFVDCGCADLTLDFLAAVQH